MSVDLHQKKYQKISRQRKIIPGWSSVTQDIKTDEGLPWWLSGYESAWQCRGHGFDPWSGKIPHAVEQLSLCTTTTEPERHNYWSPCTTTTEAHAPQLLKPAYPRAFALQKREATTMRSLRTSTKCNPCSSQLEKACTQQWRPNTAKNT